MKTNIHTRIHTHTCARAHAHTHTPGPAEAVGPVGPWPYHFLGRWWLYSLDTPTNYLTCPYVRTRTRVKTLASAAQLQAGTAQLQAGMAQLRALCLAHCLLSSSCFVFVHTSWILMSPLFLPLLRACAHTHTHTHTHVQEESMDFVCI